MSNAARFITRYNRHFIEAPFKNDAPFLEPALWNKNHLFGCYIRFSDGIFFAANRFEHIDNDFGTFVPVERGKHQGVVYCFVFSSPSVTRSSVLVERFEIFSHIPPLRPIRQQCALPAFHVDEIAAASRDLDAVLHLDEYFDPSGLPTMDYLFPGPEEDLFYAALLEERARLPEYWDDIVAYKRT